MSKSVLVIDAPENCYDCPFGISYCSELEYEGLCELAECLGCNEILMTEEHYDCESKSRPEWCPLKPLPKKFDNEKDRKLGDFEPLFKIGWNACLREITETSDENER